MVGTITYYNEPRGFGFISTTTQRFYFHIKNFQGRPVKFAKVEFDLGPSHVPDKPEQAVNVRFVDPAAAERASQLLNDLANLLAGGGAR